MTVTLRGEAWLTTWVAPVATLQFATAFFRIGQLSWRPRGGQHGHDNTSYNPHRCADSVRWRLVRPRSLVLGLISAAARSRRDPAPGRRGYRQSHHRQRLCLWASVAERPVAIRACDLSHYLFAVYLRISPKNSPGQSRPRMAQPCAVALQASSCPQSPALGRGFRNLNVRDALSHWNGIDAVAFSGLTALTCFRRGHEIGHTLG